MSRIHVEYTDEAMETEGMYIPELNLIILDGTRCEDTQKQCLLHELAHAQYHQASHNEYASCHVQRIKMEYEANVKMVEDMINHRLSNENISIDDLNWVDFADSAGVDPYLVKHVFDKKKENDSFKRNVI